MKKDLQIWMDQVTDLKKANRFLTQYQHAIEQIFIVSRADRFGTITYVNDNFVAISGYAQAELVGKNHNLVRHPDMPKDVFEEMWRTILAKQVWKGILKNQAKDGSVYVVRTAIIPILDEQGQLLEFLSLREDITELEETQTQMYQEQAKIRVLFDHQKSLVVLSNLRSLTLEQANHSFLAFVGFDTLADFQGQHDCICELFIAEEGFLQKQMFGLSWLDFLLQTPHQKHKVKMKSVKNQTHVFLVQVSAIPELADRAIISFNDITELENEKSRAQRAEKAQADFLANMSHELRTPINGILGFANLLSDTDLNREQRRFVEILTASSERLLAVVNDILDLSKIEKGELSIVPQPSNIFMDLDKSLIAFMPLAQQKSITLDIQVSEKLPECLEYDGLRLNQVLTNLISNAIKFTHEGCVTVSVQPLKQVKDRCWIDFKVADTGIGIEASKQQEVFESFKQANDATARDFGGTGLGLSIANRLVQNMGGERIELSSDVNAGSCFSFALPFKVCRPELSMHDAFASLRVGILSRYGSKAQEMETRLTAFLSAFDIYYEVKGEQVCATECSANRCVFDVYLIMDAGRFDVIAETFDDSTLYVFFDTPPEAVRNRDNVVKVEDFEFNHSHLYNILIQHVVKSRQSGGLILDQTLRIDEGKILLVEDNEVNQKLMQALLQKQDIPFDLAENGEVAVNRFQRSVYRLILMDINMPVMNGIQAVEAIRALETEQALKKTPIIALTANVMEQDVEQYLASGFDGHLAKPINFSELRNVLVTFLASDV